MRLSIVDIFAAFIVGMLIAIGVHGCSGRQYTAPESALVAIHSTAHGLALADNLVAPHCGVSSPAPDCARFVDAYAVMRASLLAAERAVDEWRRIGGTEAQCMAREALRGARGDLDAVLAILASLHVAVPDEVASAAQAIASLVAQASNGCGGAT
jgi:hypothetical protein